MRLFSKAMPPLGFAKQSIKIKEQKMPLITTQLSYQQLASLVKFMELSHLLNIDVSQFNAQESEYISSAYLALKSTLDEQRDYE